MCVCVCVRVCLCVVCVRLSLYFISYLLSPFFFLEPTQDREAEALRKLIAEEEESGATGAHLDDIIFSFSERTNYAAIKI